MSTNDAPDAARLLGIDVGGTKAVLVVARPTGQIEDERRLDRWTTGSWETDLDTLVRHAKELLVQAGSGVSALQSIGVSAPGPLHCTDGVVLEAPNLKGWVNVPVVERLSARLGARVILENDANAAALAEWRFGAGRGATNLVYVTMSTGVGAGLILDGRLYRGSRFQSGELGHAPVVPDGRPCSCGLRGCLEAYVGGAALAEMIREDLSGGESSVIEELAGGDPSRISARLWTDAIRQGDAYASRLRDRFLETLSYGVAGIVTTFDPDVVVFGTIIAENADLFIDPLIERVRARTWSSLHDVRLVPAALGARLPAYAALCVASPDPSGLSPADA